MKLKKENIFWGLFLILAGVFLIISRLGFWPHVGVIRILCAVFLAAVLLKSLVKANFGGILFPVAFLCILFDRQLGIEAITPWTVLIAATLGTIGLHMLFHKKYKWSHKKYVNINLSGDDEYDRVENSVDGSRVSFESHFGSAIKYVNTDDFQYAHLECSFGAMKVYFDNAIIQKGNATIELEVSFAGMELYIPKTWRVINQAEVSFGAIDEKNRNASTGSPTVTLIGDVCFAGATIIYI